ncbi:MAG TPA: hypothetical protein VK171_08675, partial [Fimbriimonas sp.]|nr:hypothetical protein [Fimbriimonas sp.]
MICGRALGELSAIGIVCDITPPTVIRGQKVMISSSAIPTIHVHLLTSFGDITISIALKPRAERLAA